MSCTRPVLVRKKVGNHWAEPHYYPCRKCLDCRKARGRDWTFRLLCERASYGSNYPMAFVTLTYSDKYLPKDKSLHPEDLTRFFKRLRKELAKEKRKIRYYACGEYGAEKNTFRPHYHAIIFGLGQNEHDMRILQDTWRYCEPWQFDWKYSNGTLKRSSCLENVSPADIKYVCGYVDKKLYEKKSDYEDYGLVAPFNRSSQHLGEDFFIENFDKITKHEVFIHGVPARVPSHFKTKYKDILPKEYGVKAEMLRAQIQYLSEHGFDTDLIPPYEISSTFYKFYESQGGFELLDKLAKEKEKIRGIK